VVAKSGDVSTAVGNVMTKPDLALALEDADLPSAEKLMKERGVRRLLVVRKSDHAVIGVLSVDDFAMAGFRRRAGEIVRAAKHGAARAHGGDREVPPPVSQASSSSSILAPNVSRSTRKVSDIMTKEVESACCFDKCTEAATKMAERSIGCLPVHTEENPRRICGIITDRDIIIRVLGAGLDPSVTPVQQVMSKEAVCCYNDENLADAEGLMIEWGVRRLPVLNRSTGELIGILSADDIADAASTSKAGRVLENAANMANLATVFDAPKTEPAPIADPVHYKVAGMPAGGAQGAPRKS